ncbi:hypothetical protein Taro_000751 [Colocasia esculenta]|uniref:Uncharacterized protein n=1 Tax=Colocasia esculenta TaxID=4460 RepID=A0A843T8Y5_COLES|nr:hypothetical protein [Colocasia esculenta]
MLRSRHSHIRKATGCCQGYRPFKVWFRFDSPLVDFKRVVCAGRSRREGEEERLLVVVPQLLSHQELLHTTLASSKFVPRSAFGFAPISALSASGVAPSSHQRRPHLRPALSASTAPICVCRAHRLRPSPSGVICVHLRLASPTSSNVEFKKILDKPFPYKRQLDILCGKTTVRGCHFMGSTQDVDVESR